MNIRIGTFSKEVNSTKRPGSGFGTVVTVVLKEPSNLTTPVFELHDGVWNPEYNYIYVPRWNRYYFIHEAVIEPGLVWAVQCAVDVLASWKDEIRASTAYVRRSASNYSLFIPDPTWTHNTQPTITRQNITDLANTFTGTGCYILFTVASDTATSGAVPAMTAYALTETQLRTLCNYMFSSDLYAEATTGVDTTSAALAQTFFNPFQYVVKCYWCPFQATSFSGSDGAISFGWWTCPTDITTGRKISSAASDKSILFSFTYGDNTDWTDRSGEWAQYTLYMPGFGEINLNPTYAGTQINGQLVFDFATGMASLFLTDNTEGALIQSARGKLSADVQLSALYEDVVGDMTSFSGLFHAGTGALANIFTSGTGAGAKWGAKHIAAGVLGGPIGTMAALGQSMGVDLSGGIGGLAESAVKGLQAGLQPSATTVGTAGDKATLKSHLLAFLSTVKYERLSDDHVALGGMCCRTLALSGLSGYTEIVNPEINAPATSGELTMINGFLSGGFYLE